MSKPKKLPAPFAAKISKISFEKKILARIHIKAEAEFARSLYVADPAADDQLLLQAPTDKAGLKHVKALAKAIKLNRGFVSWGKLAILAVLVVGFVVFNVVFKNMIMTNLLESGLQGLFAARVEVAGLDFDPLGGKIRLSSLSVANRDQPLRNLFELGETGIHLDLWQLVNGKVLINLIECQAIRFDSPRTSSGALPGSPVVAATPAPAATGGSNALAGFVDLNQLNAATLVAAQLDGLESIKLAHDISSEFGSLSDNAKTTGASLQAKTKDLVAATAQRIGQNLAGVRSQADLDAAIAKSSDFKAEIAAVQKEADANAKQLAELQKNYQGKLGAMQAAAKRDQANLGKTIAAPQAAGSALAGQLAQQVLGPRSRDLLGLARKIPEVLAALGQDKEQPPAPAPRQGRTVNFPVPAHPQFQISRVEGSILLGGDLKLALQAANISSDQSISGSPTSFAVHFGDQALSFDLKGLVDLRPTAEFKMTMQGGLKGFGVQLGPELAVVGLKSLSAIADAQGNYRQDKQDNSQVRALVGLRKVQAEREGANLLGRASQAALASLGDQMNGQLDLDLTAAGQFSFELKSGLDAALANGLQSALSAEVAKMQGELAAELDAQLSKALGGDQSAELKKLIADNSADIKNLKDLQKKVDQRNADLAKLGKLLGANPADLGKALGGVKLPGF